MATERQDVDVEIVDNTEDSRFEGYVEGALAGFVVYEREPGRLVLQHTEVDDSFEGQGVGSKLAAGVLDEIRRRGLVIDAQCPFIRRYISRHREYADLLA